ncbi:L-rhamnose-binding lectin CSL3-like [Salminus brasiliensis]|uniref:L-rhamnose-binding lectin CSL3-like n=1 Tax=Salminus brasiliensis TaxID=930266 RepID=UPI003B8348DB
MQAQIVSGITWMLLQLLYGGAPAASVVAAKRYLTCEGHSAHLSCDYGYIKVYTANYGRTDKTTCSDRRPHHQISNVHCFQEGTLKVMSDRCNGRRSCSVPVVNQIFHDPCIGTYKYLDFAYHCLPYKRSVICEYQEGEISCSFGELFIHHANYGRRDRTTCPHKLATTSDCYFPQTSSLRSRCNGKKSCKLRASNDVFSDPCHGVHKYLEVTYSCTSFNDPLSGEARATEPQLPFWCHSATTLPRCLPAFRAVASTAAATAALQDPSIHASSWPHTHRQTGAGLRVTAQAPNGKTPES